MTEYKTEKSSSNSLDQQNFLAGSGLSNKLTLLKYQLVPVLVLSLTLFIALLHFSKSRVYNYQIALVELLIIIVATIIYKREFFRSISYKKLEFHLVVAVLIVFLYSSYLSEFQRHAFQKSISVAVWFSYLWLTIFLLRNSYLKPIHLLACLAASCLLPMVLIAFNYFQMQPIAYQQFTFNHLQYYSNIRHAGYHATGACLFGLYFLLQNPRRPLFLFGLAVTAMNLTFLIWVGGRQGIVVIALVAPAAIIYYYRNHWLKVSFLMLSVLTLCIIFLYLTNLHSGIDILIDKLSRMGTLESFLAGRQFVWETSIDLFIENKFFGIGPENFFHLYDAIKPARFMHLTHPHSLFLQLLLDVGIVGSLFFFTLLVLVIKKYFVLFLSLKPDSPYYRQAFIALAVIAGYLINSMIDGIFYHIVPIYFFSMAIALLAQVSSRQALP